MISYSELDSSYTPSLFMEPVWAHCGSLTQFPHCLLLSMDVPTMSAKPAQGWKGIMNEKSFGNRVLIVFRSSEWTIGAPRAVSSQH